MVPGAWVFVRAGQVSSRQESMGSDILAHTYGCRLPVQVLCTLDPVLQGKYQRLVPTALLLDC